LTDIAANELAAWSLDDLDRLASAIQDPTRRNILLAFFKTDDSLTVDQVATRAGVHRTVAFNHLERLVSLGYVSSSQRRGLPGKPAKLYRRAPDSLLQFGYPARQPALLANMLIEALSAFNARGRRSARDVARRWGVALGARGKTLTEVLTSVAFLGADYQVVDDCRVVAGNCIFREACAQHRPMVCGLHSGLIEGLLTSAGLDRTVTPAEGATSTCAYQLSAPVTRRRLAR
jgi:predicted ArsR family transcriptional regulator